MPLKIVALTDTLAVAPQIVPGDIPAIATAGYRVLINNRPDGEEPGQLPAVEARKIAEASGLIYEFFPITASTLTEAQVDAFDALLKGLEGKVLAHCRSGTRCYLLWAATQVRTGKATPDVLIRQAAERGFDISSLARFA